MGIVRKGKKRPIKAEIFATICSFVIVLMGAIPMFNKQNDAKLLAVIFGSVAVGASVTNLIRDVLEKKREEASRVE